MIPPDPARLRLRSAVCTKNNYTSADVSKLLDFSSTDNCTYLVYGEEVGDNLTPHLQIFMQFKDQVSRKSLCKKLFAAFFEKAYASNPKDSAGYCMKGEDTSKPYFQYFDKPSPTWRGAQYGEISQQGKRSDLSAVCERIQDGLSMRQVASEHPETYVRFHRGVDRLRGLLMPPRNLPEMPEVQVYWGPTGVGKSYRAFKDFYPGEPRYVWSPLSGKWFDNYDYEKILVLEEFRGQLPLGFILMLLDWKECRVETKGASSQLQCDRIVITSPCHPSEWYSQDTWNKHDTYSQLTRRLTKVTHIPALGVGVTMTNPYPADETYPQFDDTEVGVPELLRETTEYQQFGE